MTRRRLHHNRRQVACYLLLYPLSFRPRSTLLWLRQNLSIFFNPLLPPQWRHPCQRGRRTGSSWGRRSALWEHLERRAPNNRLRNLDLVIPDSGLWPLLSDRFVDPFLSDTSSRKRTRVSFLLPAHPPSSSRPPHQLPDRTFSPSLYLLPSPPPLPPDGSHPLVAPRQAPRKRPRDHPMSVLTEEVGIACFHLRHVTVIGIDPRHTFLAYRCWCSSFETDYGECGIVR